MNVIQVLRKTRDGREPALWITREEDGALWLHDHNESQLVDEADDLESIAKDWDESFVEEF